VLYLIIPAAKVLGLCAVVPVGTINAPVVELASITPESAVKSSFPVVSADTLRAVPLVVPALIIDAIIYLLDICL
jgi:hypothetical protein